MSNVTQCNTCEAVVPNGSDSEMDWIHVQWGLNRSQVRTADYCTASCAVVGIERTRDEFAEDALAGLDEALDG